MLLLADEGLLSDSGVMGRNLRFAELKMELSSALSILGLPFLSLLPPRNIVVLVVF